MTKEEKIYPVIDSHTHVFPDKIAGKSRQYVSDFYNMPMYTEGTYTELKKVADSNVHNNGNYKWKIVKQLICSPAVTPEQTNNINQYISSLAQIDKSIIGFGTLHIDNTEIDYIIDNIKKNELKGIKFHFDFQKFNIDNEKMITIYKEIAKAKLPVLFHMGDERFDFSNPNRLVSVMDKVPDLKIIAAHMGGFGHWDTAYKLPVSENLYFDVSSSMNFISTEKLHKFIDKFGQKHFFFGSDFPMWNPYDELEKLEDKQLSEEQIRAITYNNFNEFLV